MIVARILLRKGRCLIGYQYRNQAYNHNPQEDLWIHRKLVLAPGAATEYVPVRVLPKRLSDSLERMMVILRGLGV